MDINESDTVLFQDQPEPCYHHKNHTNNAFAAYNDSQFQDSLNVLKVGEEAYWGP